MKVKIKRELKEPKPHGFTLSQMLSRRGIYRINSDAFPYTRFIIGDGLQLVITTDDDEEMKDSDFHVEDIDEEEYRDWTFLPVNGESITITWTTEDK